MEVYIVFFLIILIVIVGSIFISYWLPKKLGYPKVGKYLSIIVAALALILISLSMFEDQLFSKNDAKELLKEQNIVLKDEFEILHNESMSSIGDYYHTFRLKISREDKERIITEIKNSKEFNIYKQTESYFDDPTDYYNGPKRTKNYETQKQFVRELFEPQGEGYAPTWRKIEIEKQTEVLIFEEIDE